MGERYTLESVTSLSLVEGKMLQKVETGLGWLNNSWVLYLDCDILPLSKFWIEDQYSLVESLQEF